MSARGTRRPHARRPRMKPRRSAGGGGGKKGGMCSLAVASFPVGLARGVLAAWTARDMAARP